jgi:methionyl-tRNA formyltransferase
MRKIENVVPHKVTAILLMPNDIGNIVLSLASTAGIKIDAVIANDIASLNEAAKICPNILLSFGSGVIVPSEILDMPDLMALNVHAASPAYPGRDPHHFAIYDGVSRYGATLHFMTREVDAGPIVDVEMFEVSTDATPFWLLERANEAGLKLIERLFQALKTIKTLPVIEGVGWGPRKTTRKMFLEMCKIDCTLSTEEVKRRMAATKMGNYRNLYVELHGFRFRIDGAI